jgi:hypothetical protein
MPATQTNWTTLIAKRLRKEGEEVTNAELPRRWVDLIHYLDEQERRREDRKPRRGARISANTEMPVDNGKSVRTTGRKFDAWLRAPVHKLSLDSMRSVQEFAEEAFRDLLKKHRRPTTLKEMLRESARSHPANDRRPLRRSGL